MVQIEVNRQQYGVGQGCFHFQEISIQALAQPAKALKYKFVYDCGGYKTALVPALDDAFRGAAKVGINAVYISHFEFDHVNGLAELCQRANVARIYAPHIDEHSAVHLLAQQAAGGAAWSAEYRAYVAATLTVVRGEDLYGVAVTRINGGGDGPVEGLTPQPDQRRGKWCQTSSPCCQAGRLGPNSPGPCRPG